MFKSLYKKIKIGNLLFDRFIRLFFTILSLYLGANFFTDQDFFLLQQVTLFQSFLLFAICLPVNSILIRLGNSSLKYFKTLLASIFLLRLLLGFLSICFFCIYLFNANFSITSVLTIVLGLLPVLLSTVFLIEILPHIFNFEGKKNWQLIYMYIFFLIAKCLSIILFKSLLIKILIELIEIGFVLFWNYKAYLSNVLIDNFIDVSSMRVKKLVLSSSGLYLNGILSVFILRIDQFALINLVDKNTLSNYMLIVSISSLFLTPMSLLSERLTYIMSIARSKSLDDFSKISVKTLFGFLFLSLILYCIFLLLFVPICQFVFKRDLSEFIFIGLILGTTIISNSVGMIFGQINSILNGGMFTMRRSLVGCILLFVGVSVGFKFFGILGVATASASCLFLTNIVFWFFSTKVRRVIFNKN
jgi:O-antigen/teichoic acid export membrane protein